MTKKNETPCGRVVEHNAHSYDTRKGVKICDGVIYTEKRKRS